MKKFFIFYDVLLKSNWKWILLALILLLFGIVSGYLAYLSNPKAILEATLPIFETLRQLASKIKEAPWQEQIFLIFKQNIFSATFMLFSGFFFGVMPFLVIWSNGSIIGILLGIADQEKDLAEFAYSTISHAIFEIPAILITAAWGMKIGLKSFKMITVIFSQTEFESAKKFWKQTFNEAGFIWLLAFVLLFVAAFIEIGITSNLVDLLVNDG